MACRIIAILFFILAAPAFACPPGQYQWIDNWGNTVCKEFKSGRIRSIEGSPDNCPTGTHQWVDKWGNKVCKDFGSSRSYYDTSNGCPTGSFEWIDNWGNQICKGQGAF